MTSTTPLYTSIDMPDGTVKHMILTPNCEAPSAALTKLGAGHVHEVAQEPKGQFVDLANVAARIHDLEGAINNQFIASHEFVNAAAVTIAAGKSLFVESQPGTAKTRLLKAFAAGIDGNFWSNVLDTDMTKDDLLGPMSAKAISDDLWTRVWMAVADNEIVFLDEIWKAGGRVANLLLGAIEEKIVTSGNVTRRIPLVAAFSASNEIPQDLGQQAIFDRWLVRLQIGYIANRDDFRALFSAGAGRQPIRKHVTADEIRLMAGAAEVLAANAPDDVLDTAEQLWTEFGRQHSGISNRRWVETMRVAAAQSLLDGKIFAPKHLSVGRWTLWTDLSHKDARIDTILASLDTGIAKLLAYEADLNDIATKLSQLDLTDTANDSASTKLGVQARSIANQVKAEELDQELKGRVKAALELAEDIQNKAFAV